MPSASSPALSRVASPNRTHVLLLLFEVRVGVAEGRGWDAGCNRLVTSIGELALGPFPCQLSPGGMFLVRRILDGPGL